MQNANCAHICEDACLRFRSPSISIHFRSLFILFHICILRISHLCARYTYQSFRLHLSVDGVSWSYLLKRVNGFLSFWWRNFSFTIMSHMGAAKLDGHWTRIPLTSIIFVEMGWGLESICWIRLIRGYDCFHSWCRLHLLKIMVIVRTMKTPVFGM